METNDQPNVIAKPQPNSDLRSKDLLIRARALIAYPVNWCKGEYRINKKFCAVGAAYTGCGSGSKARDNALKALTLCLPKPYVSVPTFNDHRNTKHSDILALYDRAIELCDKYSVMDHNGIEKLVLPDKLLKTKLPWTLDTFNG